MMTRFYVLGAAILTVAVLWLGGLWLLQTLVAYGASHIPSDVFRQTRHFVPLIPFFPAVFLPLVVALWRRRKAAAVQDDRKTPLPPVSRRPL